MVFQLENVSRAVDGEVHLDGISLTFETSKFNTLLGPTRAGKTSLLRVLAGLDHPDTGRITKNGMDLTSVPVRKRSVAMVYQQFINYPAMSVRENITGPLKVAGVKADEATRRMQEAVALLKLDAYLDRRPSELSGGQQQRVALARALARRADLVLLDEPLANLDYKLREELRSELPRLFGEFGITVVYATTEPEEALMLGGNCALVHEGHLVAAGPVIDLYHRPKSLQAARGLSDPPLNILEIVKSGSSVKSAAFGLSLENPMLGHALADGAYSLAVRPHSLGLEAQNPLMKARVRAVDITGSETFIHLDIGGHNWTALEQGVHRLVAGSDVGLTFDIGDAMFFNAEGESVSARAAPQAGGHA